MVAVGAPKLSDADLAADYGWSLAVLNSSPDLKKLFKTAVSKQYTKERFIAEVKNTKWFRNTQESARNYQILRTSDPAKFRQEVNARMAALRDQWGSLTGQQLAYTGPELQNKTTKVDGKKSSQTSVIDGSGFLFKVADQSLKFGWNDAQIKDHLAASFNWSKAVKANTLGGTASAQMQNWRAQAHALGVDPSDDWYAARLKQVNRGDDTDEGVTGKLKSLSKQRYGAFADDIEAGQTMDDLTANYKESIGRVLEKPPAQVDVFDKNIQKAINNRNPQTGAREPMGIGDFEDMLRKDSRWQFTQNAHDSVVGTGMALLKSFGLAQ